MGDFNRSILYKPLKVQAGVSEAPSFETVEVLFRGALRCPSLFSKFCIFPQRVFSFILSPYLFSPYEVSLLLLSIPIGSGGEKSLL